MILKPIGVVRSAFHKRKEVPRLGAAAAVEIYPEFRDALLRLERHSHLWVIVWLHEAERDVLQVIPRGIEERTEANLHGIFAVRAPVRPNPLGLTLAKILSVNGTRIELDRLDFMDGTPVVDLKPYFRSRDAVYSALNQQIGKPASREALRESLRMQALNFSGGESAELDRAVDMYTDFRAEVLRLAEPRRLCVRLPLNRPMIIDAFIGMTGATPGRGTMQFGLEDIVRLHWEGGAVEYELLPGDEFRRVQEEGSSAIQ